MMHCMKEDSGARLVTFGLWAKNELYCAGYIFQFCVSGVHI